jgi:large subunit ribosomal protein L21e
MSENIFKWTFSCFSRTLEKFELFDSVELIFLVVYYKKMVKGKRIREKGKIKLSEYLKELNDGDRVCIVEEKSVCSSFPKRFQGRSGVVASSRGKYKVVKLNDGNKEKTFIVHPVHLKKL